MLVNLEPYGRLGNRLFLAAHLVAFSLKHQVPLLNLGFGDYAESFPWFDGNAAFAYPWRETGNFQDAGRMKNRFLWQERLPWTSRFRYWGDEVWNYDFQEPAAILRPLLRGKTVLFRSWLFRGPESVVRFRREILEVFKPEAGLSSAVDGAVSAWRQNEPVLVGVHVRWEDYRGTSSFLDQPEFAGRMEQVARLWPGRPVRFVLFSNETLPETGWRNLDIVGSPGSSPIFDLTAMSRCDYLMAPASTFSGWASFVGKVPLLTLTQRQLPPDLSQFQEWLG